MNNSSDLLAQNKIEYTDEQKATNVEKALEYFLTQTEKNLFVVGHSIFMKKLGTGYSMYFNAKYERTGGLFEGRFKSRHVESDEYLKYLFLRTKTL